VNGIPNSIRDEFKRVIKDYKAITILPHTEPDGDAIGTALGLYNTLKSINKSVEVVSVGVPKNLDFLSGYSKIKSKSQFRDSLVITCDTSDIDRVSIDITNRVVINIDHHKTNSMYGTLNIVNPNAPACSLVAYELIKDIFEIPASGYEAFYTSLVSDTIFFQTQNTDKNTFKYACEFIDGGAKPNYISQMLNRHSLSSIRLRGKVYESMRLYSNGKIASVAIDSKTIKSCGADNSDIVGIADQLCSLYSVEFAIVAYESNGGCKVSIRSKSKSILSIVQKFGGGGHIYAAGFFTQKKCQNIIENLIIELNTLL